MSATQHQLNEMLKSLMSVAQSGLHNSSERALIAQRLPFEIDGKVAGTVDKDTARFLESQVQALSLDDDSLVLNPVCSTDSVPVLEQIALALQSGGRLPRWRNELLAIHADDGTALGLIERAAMRPLGLRTVATHLIGLRPDGRYCLQQRAFNKDTDPGLWDTLAGGLVGTELRDGLRQRENLKRATQREAWEEAGIEASFLQGMRALPSSHINRMVEEGHMVQDNYAFLATLPGHYVPKNLDGEVERFEHFSKTDIIEMISQSQLALEPAIMMLQWFIQEA